MQTASAPRKSVRKRVRWSIALSAAVVAVGVAGCDSDSPEPVGQNPRQVTVVGHGQVQGTPDTLTVDITIEAGAADVTAAMNQATDRQQALITAVAGAGVDRKDVSTTDVTLQPEYQSDGAGAPRISGYRARNSVQIKIRTLDSASHVLAVIVDAGGNATRIDSVSYSIEDDSQLVKDARARAFEDAKSRAEQYAELSGLTLGDPISIIEGGATPPPPTERMPFPMPSSMAADVPVEPGQQTVGFSVTAVWELS